MEDSLRKNKPKDHVSPKRQSRANAPNTHDLRKERTVILTSETATLQEISSHDPLRISGLDNRWLDGWTAAC